MRNDGVTVGCYRAAGRLAAPALRAGGLTAWSAWVQYDVASPGGDKMAARAVWPFALGGLGVAAAGLVVGGSLGILGLLNE